LSSFWIGVPGDGADDRAATEHEVGCLHFEGVKGRAHDDWLTSRRQARHQRRRGGTARGGRDDRGRATEFL
jgi:hypothetical protein